MPAPLRDILNHPAIWRGGQLAKVALESIPTGHGLLDAQLPGGGWPRGALTEILTDRQGIGEFSLLIPALSQLSGSRDWVVLVAPPYIPYAPALAGQGIDLSKVIIIHPGTEQENVWAAERCLRSRACSAVIFWASGRVEQTLCRRLQLAAESGQTWGVLFRATHWSRHASPAALRLMLDPQDGRLKIHLLKRRGGGNLPEIFMEEITSPATVPLEKQPCTITKQDTHRWRRQVA